MDMEEPEIQYEQEDYESAYTSTEPDTFTELLLLPTHDKLIDLILNLKNDSEKFNSLLAELKEYATKNKDSAHLKRLETNIFSLITNLKHNDRYAETDQQIAILWFFEKICCNEKILGVNQQTEEIFLNIFKDFTNFNDFPLVIGLASHIQFNRKLQNPKYPLSEALNSLYNQKYEKLQSLQNGMKFGETMKELSEENKLMVKVGIINFFGSEYSKWTVDQNQIHKILVVLNQKPYHLLFKNVVDKKMKAVKQLRSSILKAKMEIVDNKVELVFRAKCELCNELKTRQSFEFAAKHAGGAELIPECDSESIILQGDYMYTKWPSEVLASAKEKVSYDSSEQQLNEGFLKLLSFFKKIFENRHKHIVSVGSHPKIVEESLNNQIPQETADYICQVLQLFVRFLSFNSLEINHRTNNLSELIPVTFLDELLVFFENSLKSSKISSEEEKEKMEKQEKQNLPSKKILDQSIDYLITFAAHLFYRRDFQSITAINSKPTQTLVRILLLIEHFPSKWNVLRNYKLVIDRWGESVDQGSEDYRKLAKKFLDAYFSSKVTIHSKSSSTVFNPIFATRPYCKIFGTEFLKYIELFEKELDELDSKSQSLNVSRAMNLKMSKMILFMSARVRFQEVSKIAEILANIYRKYAHIIPQIYLFRSWITQINLTKVTQQQISVKLTECMDILKSVNERLADLPVKRLIASVSKIDEGENDEIIKLVNQYKSSHYRALNALELKSKTEEYGQGIYNLIWEITKEHIELDYKLDNKIQEFAAQNKQEYDFIKQQNDLLILHKGCSIFSIIQQLKTNFLCLSRYYICNAQKMLTAKDYAALVGIIGSWIREIVKDADLSKDKFIFYLKHLFIVLAFSLTTDVKSHFLKKQILGAMRALNGGEQYVMNKAVEIPFNEVSSLYEQIKPVFIKFVKLLIQTELSEEIDEKEKKEFKSIRRQILQCILFPTTNVYGACNFNGKIQEKGTQDMVFGLFLEQAETIFKNFSVEEFLNLEQQYPLAPMLEITKNKAAKVNLEKVNRAHGRNIFAQNPRSNRGRNQAMDELRQLHIPEDYIQIALENIDAPDPQLALEWIQNNQDRMETLIMEKVLRESKESTLMKPLTQPKLELGKITPLKYPQFIEGFEKAMKELVKNFAKELFQKNDKKIAKVLFIILDAFKEDFKKKQYINLCNKMFAQINGLHRNENFDDKKYRQILRILNLTMKKEPQLFKEYYKEGICLKVLSFVGSFANGLKNDKDKMTEERKKDFCQLLQMVNKALPEWKSPPTEIKPELVMYLNCLLNIIHLSNVGNRDVWEILYKIAVLQNKQLREKIIKLFSHIVIEKSIFEEEKKKIMEEEQLNSQNNLFLKTVSKPLAMKTCMLPLVKILLEQDSQLLLANIELEIKGYIAENYKYDIAEINSGKEKNTTLEIDLKRFSTSFDKFVGSKEFEEIFKKLFSKKKNKKNSLFYDTAKHSFSESQFVGLIKSSFISVKYHVLIEEIVKTMITRPVLNESDRELQEEALIDLYKFLDYFKVLITTALRCEWWSEVDKKKTNLLEWLICRSVASNKKKFQFLAFLAMNNHMFLDQKTSISDFVCFEYLRIFRREFLNFRQTLIQINKSEDSFNEQSPEQLRFKGIFYNFLYLLQADKFNAQCFLKGQETYSIRELLEDLFIHLSPTAMPLIYALLNESIFILRKREMIDLLKNKYELVSHQQISSTANNYLTQFLNMSLIYKVDPKTFNDHLLKSKSSRVRGHFFAGSNARILVDEVDDDQNDMGVDGIDEEDEYNESISNLLRARFQQGNRSDRNQINQEAYLYPLEFENFNAQQLEQAPIQNIQQIQQKQHQQSEKIQEEQKEQISVQKISRIDYEKLLKQKSQKLMLTLSIINKLLPQPTSLTHQTLSTENIVIEQKQKMIPEQEDSKSQFSNTFDFQTSLSQLIAKAPKNPSEILLTNSKFEPNAEIKPEFISRLILNDGIEKLAKFEKRFKSIITIFSPKITSSVWEKDYTFTSSGGGKSIFDQDGRQIPTARMLLSRLERQDYGENRDEILYHIERLLNQRRQQPRQQNIRPRTLNLNQAFQDLPQEVEPLKVQQKSTVEQKDNIEKKETGNNVQLGQVKPQILNQQQSQKKISELPIEEKIIEEKIQQPHLPQQQVKENEKVEEPQEQKMQEEKYAQQTEQKVEQIVEQPINQMIPEDQPLQQVVQGSQSIIPEQPQVPQEEEVQPPQEFMINAMNEGPYREILTMFGLPQTFLADNGIDPQSFDFLPEDVQIDQITHYMNQAQNRNAINQLNQANQPPAQQNNAQQPGPNQEGAQEARQPRNNVNDVLQENIALFASMDPETRMEMLADYPPEFLMQLPVQMRTEVQQYRQRQVHRFVEVQEEDLRGLRNDHQGLGGSRKNKKEQKHKDNIKYPVPAELQFNPIPENLAEQLSRGIFLKVQKSRVLEGFRILLENYLTQEAAIATILGVLRQEDGFKITQIEYRFDENIIKKDQKNEGSQNQEKGFWKCESSFQTDPHEMNDLKECLMNLIFQTLSNSIYKNEDFLMKKIPYKNFLNLKIEPLYELEADANEFWPLYELLPYSLELCPKLSVEILKRVKQLPLKLIKEIVHAIRTDKLTAQIYKNLEFLSKNEDMKTLFIEQFPQNKPLKLEVFAKIIKYEFAKVPYLRKLHEEALNFYTSEYNEFLNQIFGIYNTEDIKQIESILVKHKHVHFQVIKYLYSQNRVLDKEPIGIILKMPHLLDFETKKYIFRKHPKIRRASRYRLPIEVSRGNILQESYNQIMSKTPKELEGRLQVTFMDEQGYDAGGLTREWLMCLSREIFRPDYALFEPSSSGNTYQPNPKSYVNPDHLQYFKFIGRFVGKALAENELVDAYFTRAFYKMILGQEIELSDLQQQDYSFYKSMLWLKENPVEKGDYTFSYLYDNFGQRIVKDLIVDGRNIDVTEQNKLEYIEKYCLAKMRDDFKAQMEKFLEGFHQMIPHECISFFEAKELELLISGLPEINFEDLRSNVDYSGYAPTDQAIKWFWEIIEEFTQEDLARLIQFITGTSKIPVDGFANIKGMNGPQRISIHKDPNPHQLPKAHTCFNQLDLPNYDTKEIMREKIVTAITWGSEGFGFM